MSSSTTLGVACSSSLLALFSFCLPWRDNRTFSLCLCNEFTGRPVVGCSGRGGRTPMEFYPHPCSVSQWALEQNMKSATGLVDRWLASFFLRLGIASDANRNCD
jgi:hypothetical protein